MGVQETHLHPNFTDDEVVIAQHSEYPELYYVN